MISHAIVSALVLSNCPFLSCVIAQKTGVNPAESKLVITEIDLEEYRKLVDNGTVSEGMLPKLQNCFYALQGGVKRVKLGKPKMLLPQETEYTSLVL